MEEEDRAADRIRSFTRWLDDAWEKNGRLGKLMILFLLVGIASPFILGVMAVVIVWVWIVPYAATVTDKVLAFGVLFSVLTALALKIESFASSTLQGLYLTRRRRRGAGRQDTV